LPLGLGVARDVLEADRLDQCDHERDCPESSDSPTAQAKREQVRGHYGVMAFVGAVSL
jgi:hypothetical protein